MEGNEEYFFLDGLKEPGHFIVLILEILRHLKIVSLNPLRFKDFLLISLFVLEHGVEILTAFRASECLMEGFFSGLHGTCQSRSIPAD